MRTTGYLGAAFVLAGCLLVLASTGALDVTVAERGMAVDTASDQNAFLGLDYAGMEDVELETDDASSCLAFPVFGLSSGCYYPDVEIVQFENNTNGALNISQTPQIQVSGGVEEAENSDWGLDGVSYETGPPGIGRVVGDFRCPVSGFFQLEQQTADSDIEIDVVASGGNLSVSLSRTIEVRCEPGQAP